MSPKIRTRTLEMPVTVLAIDSNYDDLTKIIYNYRQTHVYPYLEDKGFSIERCQGKLARRHFVVDALGKFNVEYITGMGHGSNDTFMGDRGNPIFSIDEDGGNKYKGKIVHLLSCYTAIKLGVHLVKNGCLAFFGYDIPFNYICDCVEAKVLLECDAEIDLAFAEGLSSKEVFQRVDSHYETKIREYKEKIRQARLNNEDETNIWNLKNIVKFLKVHRNHLCCPSVDKRWGSMEAQIEE